MRATILFLSILLSAFKVMAQEELRIPYAKGSIYGITSNPTDLPDGKKKGVAIICHGFNGTHHFGKDYFETLTALSYQVYSFDFPCGSVNSRTDNNTMNMSVIDEKESLKSIVKYFQKQKDVDKKNIVLIGESQGGLVSALAAADLKKQVKALVLIYPALCIPDNWSDRYPTVESIPDTTKVWNVPLGRKFFLETRDIKPYDIIGKYTGSVILIHGDKDVVVPVDYSRKAQKTYNNAELKVISGAGHGFKPDERKTSNAYVREFLQNN